MEPYRVIALDPHPAAGNEMVTHPHVSDEHVCLGDATIAVKQALATGRVCDACHLIPLQARKAISEYLEVRPPVSTDKLFIGERGPLNSRGIQSIFEKYRAITGIENLHCHVLRHSFSHTFLSQNGNLVQLAQILGHESLNTTAIYTKNSMEQLSEGTEGLVY